MASGENMVMCLMCLDSPAVAKIGSCQHSYCKQCLFSHMESQLENKQDGTTTMTSITCPTCRTSTPHCNEQEEHLESDRCAGEAGSETSETNANGQEKEGNCGICRFREKAAPAVSVCEECSSVLLCKDCTRVHRLNETTINHVLLSVSPLWLAKKKDALCGLHAKLMKYFCTTCGKSVCYACILLDHDGHKINQLGDVFRDGVSGIKNMFESQRNLLAELRADEKELTEFKETLTGMEDSVIKAIEDQAEVCIEQILKTKEALKKEVKSYFFLRDEICQRLEAIPARIAKFAEIVARMEQLLNETELHPKYVDKLEDLISQIRVINCIIEPEYARAREAYRTEYNKLCLAPPKFDPSSPDIFYGKVKTMQGKYCGICDSILTHDDRGGVLYECPYCFNDYFPGYNEY